MQLKVTCMKCGKLYGIPLIQERAVPHPDVAKVSMEIDIPVKCGNCGDEIREGKLTIYQAKIPFWEQIKGKVVIEIKYIVP